MVQFIMYSYFRKGCHKACALISLGILGVYAWVLIERQVFLELAVYSYLVQGCHGSSVHTETAKEHVR